MTPSYSDTALEYCHNVQSGKVSACKWVKLATLRHLTDLSRQASQGFPYRFDGAKANRVCAFIEHLPHVKGDLAGQLIKLDPYQVWIFCCVFGWLNHGGEKDGKRKYRRVYIELPRSSGKSCLSSAVGLYMLTAEGSQCDAFSAATSRKQAEIVFGDAQAMVRSPAAKKLMGHLGVQVNAHTIFVTKTNSKFVASSAEANSLEGLNVQWACVDELHAHPDRRVFEAITLGAGKRPESLVWSITTAGYDLAGIGYEQHTYISKVLEGVTPDETQFGCIWTIDEGDDWQDPQAWAKAHPGIGITIDRDYFEAIAQTAQAVPSTQPGFLTKYLNVWLSSNQAWADLPSWKRCMDSNLDIGRFQGRPCYIGLDLASKTDMAAKVVMFEENGHYSVFPTYYLPDAAVTDGRNSQYRGWFIEKRIRTTEGNVLDFDIIEQDILKDMQTFDVQEVGIDPYEARQLVQRLMAQNVPVVEIQQTVGNLSEPTKELDALTRSGKFHYNCPILLWMASNIVVRIDTNDNIKPNKATPEAKIDGIIATVLALARAMVHQAEISTYETGGLTVFG